MMVSPKAAEAAGDKFGLQPVCAGPYKFVERVQQDRIVVEKFADYWNKDNVFIDKITYLPIVDGTVRLANLRSGGLDLIERVLATDIKTVRDNPKLKLSKAVSLGYVGLTINLANGPKADTPLAKDARVRRAFELAIDRDAINQVVFNGEFVPGNQWVSPQNSYYQQAFPIPKRDVAKAKALLKEAGVTGPITLDFMVPNGAENRAVAEVVQSMAAEAGFDLKIRVTEFATSLKQAEDGDFQLYLIGWSGRSDPDGNSYSFQTCGAPQNNGRLLRQGSRRRARRGARQERSGRAQEGLREGRREVPRRRLDHLPLSPAGAGRAHRQARGLQADARRPGARGRPQAEVSSRARLPHPAAAADHPDADPGVDADLRPAAAAAGRSGADHGGRGARSQGAGGDPPAVPARSSRSRSSTSTG